VDCNPYTTAACALVV